MTNLKLICLPFAGGSKFAFNDLKKILDPRIAMEAVEYPGRGYRIREALIKDHRALLDDLFHQVKDHTLSPYAFFGHSMGAGFAYLLAHRLKEEGYPQPLHIFASGRNGPAWVDPDEPIHLLPKEQFIEKLRELGGSPEEVLNNAALMEMFEPILRADFSVLASYRHDSRPPLDIPITVMTGAEEKDITEEGLALWQQESRLPVNYIQYPGTHFFIFEQWPAIAGVIARALL